jgi:hypothetical protein
LLITQPRPLHLQVECSSQISVQSSHVAVQLLPFEQRMTDLGWAAKWQIDSVQIPSQAPRHTTWHWLSSTHRTFDPAATLRTHCDSLHSVSHAPVQVARHVSDSLHLSFPPSDKVARQASLWSHVAWQFFPTAISQVDSSPHLT